MSGWLIILLQKYLPIAFARTTSSQHVSLRTIPARCASLRAFPARQSSMRAIIPPSCLSTLLLSPAQSFWIPVFQAGVWNAWIFLLFPVLQNLIIWLFNKPLYRRTGQPPESTPSTAYQTASFLTTVVWILSTLYAIFLPLRLGTIWLYIGFALLLGGILFSIAATINFARTPVNSPVTSGAYRYSRHPLYLSFILIYLGTSLATLSWIFLLITVILAGCMSRSADEEENFCLKQFGKTYQIYQTRTPKWIGIPKH